MHDLIILAITGDINWVEPFRSALQDFVKTRFIMTESMEEACELLDAAGSRLILVNWDAENTTFEQMDHLLWANTILARPAAVLVVADGYRPDHALTLFQMGVDEYLSKSDHADRLPAIVSQLLNGTSSWEIKVDAASAGLPNRVQKTQPIPAEWITAASPA
jgi:DNA-binding NarL/FixJ family response regulator